MSQSLAALRSYAIVQCTYDLPVCLGDVALHSLQGQGSAGISGASVRHRTEQRIAPARRYQYARRASATVPPHPMAEV